MNKITITIALDLEMERLAANSVAQSVRRAVQYMMDTDPETGKHRPQVTVEVSK